VVVVAVVVVAVVVVDVFVVVVVDVVVVPAAYADAAPSAAKQRPRTRNQTPRRIAPVCRSARLFAEMHMNAIRFRRVRRAPARRPVNAVDLPGGFYRRAID
jgi:hypothetical protein